MPLPMAGFSGVHIEPIRRRLCLSTPPGGASKPELLGALGGLGPVADAELPIQGRRVILDRVWREEEPLGDLAIGSPGPDELEDLPLALRQRRRRTLGLPRAHR